MYKIWIVEDDKTIAKETASFLKKWGYETGYVKDFKQVEKECLEFSPHLILMDISLPFYDGFYWCQEIRKKSSVPILFLSSSSDNMSIIMAVNMGGDDFVTKPFDLHVLAAKIQALLRRTYSYQEQITYMEHKGALFYTSDGTFHYHGKKIDLTKNEFKIMQILFENKGKIVKREEIMVRLWDDDCFVDDNTLTVNMTRLRKKLEEISLENFIQTKKGQGYRIGEEH
ncbi:MAG: response regulator transcription factor [Lachnospiraceae bacterium]|jgi:two-component system response regulator protein BraR/BceR|nr:response regulator transcription factor [Lachnospiraceae bacterium]